MELEAQQIIILLNVPFKTEQVTLDLDAIYHPELKSITGLSKYPYITPNVKYTFAMIKELTNQGYSKVISFFFDKRVFQKILYKYSRIPDKDNSEIKNDAHNILQYNAMIMLKMIFPTYYPSVQNVTNSMEEYILQKGANPSYKTLFGFNKMSYVKIDEKIHTITKTVLLNDLLNHPVYKNAIKRSNEYFSWSKKQKDSIATEMVTGFEKLKGLIQGDLEINSYKVFFEKEREKYKSFLTLDPSRPITKVDEDKRMFAETITTLLGVMNELDAGLAIENTIENKTNIHKTVEYLYESINNIKELYTRISGYNILSKSQTEFSNRVNRLLEESKKLASISKIWKSYIEPRNINVRIEDENPDILNLLRSKYKPYMDYVEVIRSIIYPSRETSNTLLQECIKNYSQNRVGGVKLTTIFKMVHDKYMYVYGENVPSAADETIPQETLIEYMNVGVCMINAEEQEKPRYEIQISMNLIENEYTVDTLSDIKCIYDGFVLGKELEDKLDNTNPYEIELHAFYLSQADIDSQKSQKMENVSAPSSSQETRAPSRAAEQRQPPNTENPPSAPEKKVKFVGGKSKRRKTRKHRIFRRKTRNHRYRNRQTL